MQPKDTIQLEHWLRGKASLSEVESIPSIGLVGNERFTESARRAFRLIWSWSTYRYGGSIGRRQDELWKRHGREFLDRRIARCNAKVAKFLGGN